MIDLFLIPIFFAILLGGFLFSMPQSTPFDPSTIASQTLVPISQQRKNTLELGAFDVHTQFLPTPTPTGAPTATPPPSSSGVLGLGSHGAFKIYTPDEAKKAHNAGVTYNIIDYWGSGRTPDQQDIPVQPTSAVGKALLSYNMKTVMNLSGCDVIGSYTPNGNPCISANQTGGGIYLNEARLIQRVKAAYNNGQNPLLGGYWIKDDDMQICGDGEYSAPMTAKLQRSYQLIRGIDHDPSHIIIAGFCVNADLRKNYHPTVQQPIADAIAMYPYPNLYGYLFVGRNLTSEVPAEVATIKANTPAGTNAPTVLGIYQGFWSSNCYRGIYHCNGGIAPISQAALLQNAQSFMNNGFSGLIDFAFEAEDVDHLGGNDNQMLQYAQAVTNYLKSIGKY
jgi:hypothetical protein